MSVSWIVVCFVLVVAVVLLARRLRHGDEQRRRLDARLVGVLEGPDAGLSVWDRSGRLVGFNRRFKEFYPDVPLEPGVVYEDLIRYTANRGLVDVPADDIERWVTERVGRFGQPSHEVLRTANRRWLDVHSRRSDAGEVLVLFTDTTDVRDKAETLSDQSKRLKQKTRDVVLVADITGAAGAGDTPESMAGRVLELVCERWNWPVGYAYSISAVDGRPRLGSVLAWHSAEPAGETAFAGLRQVTEKVSVPRDEGIAGRALQTHRLVWIPNVSVEPALDESRRALMPGIRGMCAVPIVHRDTVLLVLEFLSREQLAPDPNVVRILETIARVVGLSLRPSV